MDPRRVKVIRDTILFVFGLAGITYETVVVNVDRPTLLVLFAGCVGLPVFLRKDESQTNNMSQAEKSEKDKEEANE